MNPDVFHITHIDNLASILRSGGLWSDAQRIQQGFANQNIGYSHIKQRRLQHPVTVAQGRSIGHYVPFNFCSRSVMLYVVHRGHNDYRGGQENIIHLVTDIDAVRQLNVNCFFTDIHADLNYAEQINDFNRLNELSWDSINEYYWSNVKEEKQAEFLAFQSVPWAAIKEIGVRNEVVANQVRQCIATSTHQPLVQVRPQWYY